MIPLLVILEIIILCLGATIFLYRPQMRISETMCFGIIVALLILSCLYQTVFLIGVPQLAFIFEVILVIASLILLKRRSNYLRIFKDRIIQFCQANKILSTLLGSTFTYLLLQIILLPPSGPDFYAYHLPRILLFQQEKTLYLENITTLRQAIFPLGWNILIHSFLRFYTDYGLGIFNFLIYLAIALGTYAVSRRITSQKIAIVTTLVVITMPQIVLSSTSVSTDLPLAGLSIFCWLILFRLNDKLNIYDLVLLILVAFFGLSIKLTFLLFLAPFTLLGNYLLIKKYSLNHLIKFMAFHWKWLAPLSFPVVILSQIWLYIHNVSLFGGWSGPPDYIDYFQQADGLKGAFANFMRYLFEVVDFMSPTDSIGHHLLKIKPSHILEKVYNKLIYPAVGDAGIIPHIGKFRMDWRVHEACSWYGILGFLLAIPSIIYSTLKGDKVIKIVALTLLLFFVLLCYKVGWSPWRGRYFSLFFVSSGICIAYTLDCLSSKFKNQTKILLKGITALSLITLLMVLVSSEHESIINLRKANSNELNFSLSQINLGQEKEHRIAIHELNKIIEPGSNLALLGHIQVNLYLYLLTLPSINITPIHTSSYPDLEYRFASKGRNKEYTNHQFPNPLQSNPDSFDYLLCLDVANCSSKETNLPHKSRQLIWSFQPSGQYRGTTPLNQAQLFRLHKSKVGSDSHVVKKF